MRIGIARVVLMVTAILFLPAAANMTSTASRAISLRAVSTRIYRRAARATVCPSEGRHRAGVAAVRHLQGIYT